MHRGATAHLPLSAELPLYILLYILFYLTIVLSFSLSNIFLFKQVSWDQTFSCSLISQILITLSVIFGLSAVDMIWKLILGARECCVFNRLHPRRPNHNLFGRNCHRKGKTTEPSAKTLIPDCAWVWCLPTLKAIGTDTNPAGIWRGSLSLCFSHCLSHGLVEICKCHFRLPLMARLLWAGGTGVCIIVQ